MTKNKVKELIVTSMKNRWDNRTGPVVSYQSYADAIIADLTKAELMVVSKTLVRGY